MIEAVDEIDRVIIECIQRSQRQGYSPSLEELGECIGMTKQGASRRVRKLIELGILARPGNRKRALVVRRAA